MRILIVPTGSHGDVLPFIGIGRELQDRGEDVVLFCSGKFTDTARSAGLRVVPLGAAEDYDAVLRNPDTTHQVRGPRIVAKMVHSATPHIYNLLARCVVPGQTIVIGSTLSLAARLLQETHSLPAVIGHLAPSVYRSSHQMPRLGPLSSPNFLPTALKRLLWRMLDRVAIDPIFASGFNVIRSEMGLPPVQSIFGDWLHQADLSLGLFPGWFAPAQPDWPGNTRFTGFPLFDDPSGAALPEDLAAFLEAGGPPVAFTSGTATAAAHDFFQQATAACVASGRRGILLTQFPDQLPGSLPDGLCQVSYAPFSALLPRVSAFVHHGGIGTTSQALRAGVPQLIRPMAYDQFDNASRVARLGVGRELSRRRFRAPAIARLLDTLTTDPAIHAACAETAARFAGTNPLSDACDAILSVTRPRV